MADSRTRHRRSRWGFGGRDPDLAPASRARHDGNDKLRRCLSDSRIALDASTDEGSYTGDKSRQSSSWKASRRPIKVLITNEMSSEKRMVQSSPSLVARLMGLDALPPVFVKEHKDMKNLSSKTGHVDDLHFRMTSREHDFKDVFEIKNSQNSEKHKNQTLTRGTSSYERDASDVAYVKQKFLEAKRLSTDETLQNSKEFNDALEVLDSNDDLVLQFLQEPNPLFAKHLHNLKFPSSPPRESNITILKSAKNKKHEIGEGSHSSETRPECYGYLHKDLRACKKHINRSISPSVKEHASSVSQKVSKRSANKTERSSKPTWIVVLKPSLDKIENLEKSVLPTKSLENEQSVFRKHEEFQQVQQVQQMRDESRERQGLFDKLEHIGRNTNDSREIAREVTKEMKRTVSISKKKPYSGCDKYTKDENMHAVSSRNNSNNFETYQSSLKNNDYNSSYSSSSCSVESSASKEAVKRLSKRWQMTQQFQDPRLVVRSSSSSTLGEMLTQSDREASRETLMSRKASHEKSSREMLGSRLYPSGISSRDGWKEGCSENLSRSSSLSASSTAHCSNSSSRQHVDVTDRCYMLKDLIVGTDNLLPDKLNQRESYSQRSLRSGSYKSRSLNSGVEGNEEPVREIHVNTEKLKNVTTSTDRSEVGPISSEFSLSTNSFSSDQVNSSFVESIDVEDPFLSDDVHVQQGTQDEQFCGEILTNIEKDCEETVADNSLEHFSEEAEQPSPASVLDLSCEDNPSPESFERVNAGLRGLRMQLQLLRMEKSDLYDEESEALILSEDDTDQKTDMLPTSGNKEERELSYIHAILVDSGIHGAKIADLVNTCYSIDCPVHPVVFEKLEDKYDTLDDWSTSERKLLFDLTNFILADLLAHVMDLQPRVKANKTNFSVWSHEGLLEEVFQIVTKLREGLSEGRTELTVLDPRWLVAGDNTDTMAREIECTLKEDLIDELVSDCIFG